MGKLRERKRMNEAPKKQAGKAATNATFSLGKKRLKQDRCSALPCKSD